VKRALKFLLVCTMLALVPLRGIAAVTVGACAAGEHETLVQAAADHDHGDHGHGAAPDMQDEGNKADCGACAEHCAGASFVAQATSNALSNMAGAERALPGELFAAGHVPEHLDPPPLAL
jgi:hypothetical protein